MANAPVVDQKSVTRIRSKFFDATLDLNPGKRLTRTEIPGEPS